MKAAPRLGLATALGLSLLLSMSPATATTLSPTPNPLPFPRAPFELTFDVLEVGNEPATIQLAPSVTPRLPFLFFTLANLTDDRITALDLELGRVVNGAFLPSAGSPAFSSPPGVATFVTDGDDLSSLSPDGTAARLDFAQIFLASGQQDAAGDPLDALLPTRAATVNIDLTGDLSGPLALRATLTAVPEPAAGVFMVGLLGLISAPRRGSRRVE